MSKIQFGGAGEIRPVKVAVPNDEFENMIRKYGVVASCEWFGHSSDSEFTAEAIKTLRERSDFDAVLDGAQS